MSFGRPFKDVDTIWKVASEKKYTCIRILTLKPFMLSILLWLASKYSNEYLQQMTIY